jgi:hypothetical protein
MDKVQKHNSFNSVSISDFSHACYTHIPSHTPSYISAAGDVYQFSDSLQWLHQYEY